MAEIEANEKLNQGISAALEDNEVLANWICIAEIFGMDGARNIWIEHDDLASLWDLMGLLKFAERYVQRKIDAVWEAASGEEEEFSEF